MIEYSHVEKFVPTAPPAQISTGHVVKCECSSPNSTVSIVQRNVIAVNPSGMSVCRECCVVLVRGLRVGLITRDKQISMPPVGFEPTVSAGERPQTYALDRAATGTDMNQD